MAHGTFLPRRGEDGPGKCPEAVYEGTQAELLRSYIP